MKETLQISVRSITCFFLSIYLAVSVAGTPFFLQPNHNGGTLNSLENPLQQSGQSKAYYPLFEHINNTIMFHLQVFQIVKLCQYNI